ncbi:MAG: hypothetical protein IKW02_04510 [Clostridia bacterium]|nr:hypothetical protein [Clostridia bacterium]
MEKLTVDFGKIKGKIKAMHAVGQPPIEGLNTTKFSWLKDANIPYSRLHDVGGWMGANMFVDIPNLFRDFDADETKEENYDFAFTDILIKGLIDNGVEPYFRLGVTIENFHKIKAYRIFPPKDFAKWARICEHVIRHYNYGWADGFHYNIKYWEIWNEPDNEGPKVEDNQMWKGTKEEFYEFYGVAAKHLKACFGDEIKVGGYGCCGLIYTLITPEKYGLEFEAVPADDPYMNEHGKYYVQFFEEFIEYVAKNNIPFDFFSWHGYVKHPMWLYNTSRYMDKKLKEFGFENIENHVNEWSVCPTTTFRGTKMASARCAATMLKMQDASTNVMCIYDARARAGAYAALFRSDPFRPTPLYFALKAFGDLYVLGNQVESGITDEDLFVQAAVDGDKKAVMISNISEEPKEVESNLGDDMIAYIVDDKLQLETDGTKAGKFVIEPNAVILFKNY